MVAATQSGRQVQPDRNQVRARATPFFPFTARFFHSLREETVLTFDFILRLKCNFVFVFGDPTFGAGRVWGSKAHGEISSDLYHHQNGLANSNCCVPLIIVGFPR